MSIGFRCLFLLAVATGVQAEDFPDLPSTAAVTRALSDHPVVTAALAGVGAANAYRDGMIAGPHEFTFRWQSQQRRETLTEQRYQEAAVGLERTLRLPGKGATDQAIGEAGLQQARHGLADARHETARLLLASWFGWQREQAAADQWQAQTDILRRQQEAAGRRFALGDSAQIEVSLATAQLDQALAQEAQARTRAKLAATDFALQFPTLVPTEMPVPAEPRALAGPAAAWLEKLLAHNHELGLAAAASRRQQLSAQRADAERLPDPTLGVSIARERDGQEKLIGLQLSFPLPGSARSAASRAAVAEADAASAREAQVKIKVEAQARRTLKQAEAAYEQWERLAAVARRMEENAALLDKAWRLGEGQFGDLQQARRQAVEARLAAVQAQLDANENRYRVLLDAHELWMLAGEAEEEGALSLP